MDEDGTWLRPWRTFIAELDARGRLQWETAFIDGEGFYIASVPALRGCHTQARSLHELMERIKEAIEARPEGQGEADSGLEFVSVQRVRLAS